MIKREDEFEKYLSSISKHLQSHSKAVTKDKRKKEDKW